MELAKAIKGRRSIRKFTGQKVSRDDVEAIIEAGRCAPSAGNLQDRDFFVVEGQELKEKLVVASLGQKFIAEAQVVIVVCANLKRIESYEERGANLYTIQDSAASCQNMLLTIHSLGLASCWVGAFDEHSVHKVMGLQPHLRPVAIIPIGYPGSAAKERKKRDDDVHWIG